MAEYLRTLVDRYLSRLTGADVKVLLYVVRRTVEFHKTEDSMTVKQICEGIRKRDGTWLDRGTGLSRRQAQSSARRLEGLELVKVVRRIGRPSIYALGPALLTPPAQEPTQGGAQKRAPLPVTFFAHTST